MSRFRSSSGGIRPRSLSASLIATGLALATTATSAALDGSPAPGLSDASSPRAAKQFDSMPIRTVSEALATPDLAGGCCLPSGDCMFTTELGCETMGGIFLGGGSDCTPVDFVDEGLYRLRSFPTGLELPPPYGLRLDELFDVTAGNDVFSFDFDVPGAGVFLQYDGGSLVRIFGIAYGGLDIGDDYDPAWTSWLKIDFTYTTVTTLVGDDDLYVITPSGTNSGTVTWLETGEVIEIQDKVLDDGFSFRFGDDVDMGYPGITGIGWLMYVPDAGFGVKDWRFVSEDVCIEAEPFGACCMLDGSCMDSITEASCLAIDGSWAGPNTFCADVVCDPPSSGACCLPDGTCAVLTLEMCDAEGGEYLGDGTACTPAVQNLPGCWTLRNHPDGNAGPPAYGLRLDELFDVTGDNDVFTFDFDGPDSDMALCYDGTSIRISGVAFGGRDVGTGYDPDYMSLVEIDFTYSVVENADSDDDLVVLTPSMTNTGTLTWLATGEVINLSDKANMAGLAFRFGDTDDDAGHRGFAGVSGWGWLTYDAAADSGSRDWLFTAVPVCDPAPPIGACCLPTGDCIESTIDQCDAAGGDYAGDGTTCADVDCTLSPTDCCEYGKPRLLRMLFTGEGCEATDHSQDPNKVSCETFGDIPSVVHIIANSKENPNDGEQWFDGLVTVGTTFDIDAANAGKDDLKGKTFIHVYDPADGSLLQRVEFHTSCSQPLFSGDQFGGSKIVGCIGADEPIEGDCCADGKPRALVMLLTGDDCSASSHSQNDDKVECDDFGSISGTVYVVANDDEDADDGDVWFAGNVTVGEEFVIDAMNAGEDDLSSETHIHIFDVEGGTLLQHVEFHTSCSQPLFVGNQFGGSALVDCIREGEPMAGDCCAEGKPRAIVMLLSDDDCSATMHGQNDDKVECEDFGPISGTVYVVANDDEDAGDGDVWFAGSVTVGDEFTIDALNAGEDKLSTETHVHIFDVEGGTLLQHVEFHTSCSQPLFVGNQFGASTLVDCIPQGDPIPGDPQDDCCADDAGKPRLLTMLYTGDGCVMSHSQDDDKANCDGDAAETPVVRIVATDDEDPDASDARVWFDGLVGIGGLYDMDAANAGETKFRSKTFIYVYDLDGTLLQSIEFHTSCSQPLFIGDQFGSAVIIDCIGSNH